MTYELENQLEHEGEDFSTNQLLVIGLCPDFGCCRFWYLSSIETPIPSELSSLYMATETDFPVRPKQSPL